MINDDRLPLKEKFLDYFRQLPIQKLAAGVIGKSEDTITNWKNEDPDFSGQIDSAKSEWALDKTKKVQSREWLLERVINDHFGNKTKQDITSNGQTIGVPILNAKTLDVPENNSNGQDTKTK